MTTLAPRRVQRLGLSKGDRRERALLAAAQHRLESGEFASASVADLAAEAEISRATFYFYFASKQALLSAVIAAAVATFQERLVEQMDGAPSRSPADVVAETVRAATDLWWDNRVVLTASVELGAAIPELYDLNRETISHVSRLTLSLLRTAGHVDGADEDIVRRITALVLMTERNFYDLARRSRRRRQFDDLGNVLTDIWLSALSVGDQVLPHPPAAQARGSGGVGG